MEIKVAPDDLKSMSDLVIEDIRDIRKHWEAIGDIVSGSRNYWEGDSSEDHVAIYEDVADEVDKLIRGLEEKQTRLRTMAGIYDEPEAAAETPLPKLPSEVF